MKRSVMLFSLLAFMLFTVQLTYSQATTKKDAYSPKRIDNAGDVSTLDPTIIDAKHYKVVFENDQVRVLRISYGAGEKSVMHKHPEGIAVFLTDGKGKFNFPDGKTKEISWKAGQTIWLSATTHQPENLTNVPFELIQVELKASRK